MANKKQKRKTGATAASSTQPLKISEEERWRLVTESGVLHKLQSSAQKTTTGTSTVVPIGDENNEDEGNPLAEEIFNAIVLIIPFSFCLLLMNILIHRQYGREATVGTLADRLVSAIPIMSIFIFYTNRYKQHRRMQFWLFAMSVAVGCRMIWMVNRGNWLANMRQCPPLATAWIYTIVQLELGPAVLALVGVGGWTWWAGMKLSFD